jgi:hypothetical protein
MGLWIAARGCREKDPEQAFNGTVFHQPGAVSLIRLYNDFRLVIPAKAGIQD